MRNTHFQNTHKGTPPDIGSFGMTSWQGTVPASDLSIKAVRSSGAGGQNVNKTSTNVHIRFHIGNSNCLNEAEKVRVREWMRENKPSLYVESQDIIQLSNQEERSMQKNKQNALSQLDRLIQKALKPVIERRVSVVPESVKQKRLRDKAHRAKIKMQRSNQVSI